MKTLSIPASGQALRFQYTNWRNETHVYLVTPLTVEFGPYHQEGMDKARENQWVLHALMITRDGESRPVGRRTFMLSGLIPVPE